MRRRGQADRTRLASGEACAALLFAWIRGRRTIATRLSRVIYREAMSLGRIAIRRYDVMRGRYVNLWIRGYRKTQDAGPRLDKLKLYALTAGIEAVALRYIENDEEHRILEAVPALVELGIAAVAGNRPAGASRGRRG